MMIREAGNILNILLGKKEDEETQQMMQRKRYKVKNEYNWKDWDGEKVLNDLTKQEFDADF